MLSMNFNTAIPENMNFLWAALLIEELRRQGITHFFIAPGSRSAPLAFAAGNNPGIKTIVHFDERSLAFTACGYAAGSEKPAVLICTSGTAAANFLPGIIEASKKKLPLIVITADRPPELQKTGAAQTIEQENIFSAYVRWSFTIPCPTKKIPAEFILTTAAQLFSRTRGELPGPVHLNMMLREPLSPVIDREGFPPYTAAIQAWAATDSPYTLYHDRHISPTEISLKDAAARIERIKNGLILVGKISGKGDRAAVIAFAERTGFPVFADITSGLRLGHRHPQVITYYDHILADHKDPIHYDGIIHFGGRMTSKHCMDLVASSPLNDYLMILGHPLRSDPLHKVTARYTLKPASFIEPLLPMLRQRPPTAAAKTLHPLNISADQAIEQPLSRPELSEPSIARTVSQLIPESHGLFLSNSMPVRDMDKYASPDGNRVVVGTNRGASGIDGIISSAIGFAEGINAPVTLLIGDLAFLYDINALSLLQTSAQKLIIVAVNNNGGGIFSLLPSASNSQVFEKFFTTPHGFSFQSIAAAFNVNYSEPMTLPDFRNSYLDALKTVTSTIIELKVPRRT
jgi:2-succinyl-5-enolpyruvyl-6-hydroxy-3-cyclohexene-1-carboxylate synthase